MKKLFFYSLVLIFVSCSSDDNGNGEEVFEPQEVEIIEIGHGAMAGPNSGLDESYLVIKNTTEWIQLLEAIDAVNNESENFSETTIDFSQYLIIAAIDEVKYNGGWSIDITSIMEYEPEIEVTVENLLTGNLTSIVRQPFHIVKIPKSDKPVVFERIYTED